MTLHILSINEDFFPDIIEIIPAVPPFKARHSSLSIVSRSWLSAAQQWHSGRRGASVWNKRKLQEVLQSIKNRKNVHIFGTFFMRNIASNLLLKKFPQFMVGVDSERLSSRTSFQLEDEVLDTSEP